ncbi:MAG: ABC transporter permease [Bacillus sp. (in: Bacteria)]|nr:ABC transporter permease [Bacillus sp. (in: firmicutes)]
MSIRTLIIRHLWRNKRRVMGMFLCLVIVLTTISSLYHLLETMNDSLGKTFDEIGANIIITPKQDELDLAFGHITIQGERKKLQLNEIDKVHQIQYSNYIAHISPKLIDEVTLNKMSAAVMGLFFENEKKVKMDMTYEGQYPVDTKEILVGSEVAAKHSISIDDTLTFFNEDFNVTGILHDQSHKEMNHFIFMDLTKAQALFNRPNEISLIEIAAHCHRCPVHEIAGQIRVEMTGAEVRPLMDIALAREVTLDRFRMFFYVVAIILLLAGSYLLIYFMSSYTSKRRQEIGIFRTIGFENKTLEKIILGEAFWMGTIGGLVSYITSLLVVAFSNFLWFENSLLINIAILNFLAVMGLSILMMAIAVIGPLRYASTLDPVRALHNL